MGFGEEEEGLLPPQTQTPSPFETGVGGSLILNLHSCVKDCDAQSFVDGHLLFVSFDSEIDSRISIASCGTMNCRILALCISTAGSPPTCGERASFVEWSIYATGLSPGLSPRHHSQATWASPRSQENGGSVEYFDAPRSIFASPGKTIYPKVLYEFWAHSTEPPKHPRDASRESRHCVSWHQTEVEKSQRGARCYDAVPRHRAWVSIPGLVCKVSWAQAPCSPRGTTSDMRHSH